MSYNTRRTGARVGPQVNYHQAPQSANQQRPPGNRPGQNPGYTTTQSSNYGQSGFSQSGYSSMQREAKQAPPSSQQPQPPQQQQQQAPQQVPPPNPTPQQPIQPQPASPQIAAPQKVEAQTPPAPQSQDGVTAEEKTTDANGEGGKKKPFWLKKGPGYKVSKKVRRRRQNARLRKILTPKNALMILYELHQGIKFTTTEQLNALAQTVYTVTVDVEGKQHHGQALSKSGAKQLACENALKALLLDKMGKAVQQDDSDQIDLQESGADESVKSEIDDDNMDGSSVSSRRSRRPEDDVPWGCLASFALHKLFLEWQNQGLQVPIPNSRSVPSLPKGLAPEAFRLPIVAPSGSPMPMKKMPDDVSKCNPVQLLNQLKPGCQYTEQSDGVTPHLTFTISVLIDGQEYIGVAGNKKEAKRQCARSALIKMGIWSEDHE